MLKVVRQVLRVLMELQELLVPVHLQEQQVLQVLLVVVVDQVLMLLQE